MILDTCDAEAAIALKYNRWEKSVLGVALESREVIPCIYRRRQMPMADGSLSWFSSRYPDNLESDELVQIPPVLSDLE
eukprot:5307884-Pyramimonas_sp.AAC.1